MRAIVALGSNLGDRWTNLAAALEALRLLGWVAPSPLVMETPDESGSGPDYLNTVVSLETELDDPCRLLEALLRIELRLGRDRMQGRNAPRTLDLDLLLYGDEQIASPTLTVPHPRITERAFVLVPLLELAPAIVVPGLGAAQDYLASVADQAISQL